MLKVMHTPMSKCAALLWQRLRKCEPAMKLQNIPKDKLVNALVPVISVVTEVVYTAIDQSLYSLGSLVLKAILLGQSDQDPTTSLKTLAAASPIHLAFVTKAWPDANVLQEFLTLRTHYMMVALQEVQDVLQRLGASTPALSFFASGLTIVKSHVNRVAAIDAQKQDIGDFNKYWLIVLIKAQELHSCLHIDRTEADWIELEVTTKCLLKSKTAAALKAEASLTLAAEDLTQCSKKDDFVSYLVKAAMAKHHASAEAAQAKWKGASTSFLKSIAAAEVQQASGDTSPSGADDELAKLIEASLNEDVGSSAANKTSMVPMFQEIPEHRQDDFLLDEVAGCISAHIAHRFFQSESPPFGGDVGFEHLCRTSTLNTFQLSIYFRLSISQSTNNIIKHVWLFFESLIHIFI